MAHHTYAGTHRPACNKATKVLSQILKWTEGNGTHFVTPIFATTDLQLQFRYASWWQSKKKKSYPMNRTTSMFILDCSHNGEHLEEDKMFPNARTGIGYNQCEFNELMLVHTQSLSTWRMEPGNVKDPICLGHFRPQLSSHPKGCTQTDMVIEDLQTDLWFEELLSIELGVIRGEHTVIWAPLHVHTLNAQYEW